jgi:hypothetical protein
METSRNTLGPSANVVNDGSLLLYIIRIIQDTLDARHLSFNVGDHLNDLFEIARYPHAVCQAETQPTSRYKLCGDRHCPDKGSDQPPPNVQSKGQPVPNQLYQQVGSIQLVVVFKSSSKELGLRAKGPNSGRATKRLGKVGKDRRGSDLGDVGCSFHTSLFSFFIYDQCGSNVLVTSVMFWISSFSFRGVDEPLILLLDLLVLLPWLRRSG